MSNSEPLVATPSRTSASAYHGDGGWQCARGLSRIRQVLEFVAAGPARFTLYGIAMMRSGTGARRPRPWPTNPAATARRAQRRRRQPRPAPTAVRACHAACAGSIRSTGCSFRRCLGGSRVAGIRHPFHRAMDRGWLPGRSGRCPACARRRQCRSTGFKALAAGQAAHPAFDGPSNQLADDAGR